MSKSIFLTITLVTTLVLQFLMTLPRVQPVSIDKADSLTGDIGWKGGFTVNGTDTFAVAVAVFDSKVYVGGDFNVAGNASANYVGMWDGSNWTSLGNGLDNQVNALAVDRNGNLYAGGYFTSSGNQLLSHIARWNGQSWASLGTGINGLVWTIAIAPSGDLYVGGEFDMTGGVEAHNIAKWDGTSWSALDTGVSSSASQTARVRAIAIDRFGFVYVGGEFTDSGGVPASNISRWDGKSWSAVGKGVTGSSQASVVLTLAADDRGNLYAGGEFDTAGGLPAHNLAKWNGDQWSDVGGGVKSLDDKNPPAIISIIADGGDIFAAGIFDRAGEKPVGSIALWDGVAWNDLKGGVGQDLNLSRTYGLAIDRDGLIYSVGAFTLAGGKCANNVAVWDGAGWNGLGEDTSVNGLIRKMIPDRQGGYYLAGGFTCAGGQVVNHIAHWDGASGWSGLAGGLSGGLDGATPRALALDHNGNLYVGGDFTQAGNISVNHIAKWTGTQWEALGEGLNNDLVTLAIDSQDRLYAGGMFYVAGSDPTRYVSIFRWNGSQWEEIGPALNNLVNVIAFDDQGRLIAGGYFSAADGVPIHGIARWDGQKWEDLASQFVDIPEALLVDGDIIYGSGHRVWKIQNGKFDFIDGFADTAWTFDFQALALDQKGRLIVGGLFLEMADISVTNIARWNGQYWENFGSGLAGYSAYAINVDANGNLLVGGEFNQAGGKISQNLAIWTEPNYLWLPLINR